jgi:hypothetical protein
MNNDTPAPFAPILDIFFAEMIETACDPEVINIKDLRRILLAMPEGAARDALLAKIN